MLHLLMILIFLIIGIPSDCFPADTTETVTVNGLVNSHNFPGGEILIFAFDREELPRIRYDAVGLPKPGPFTLKIPSQVDAFYICGYVNMNDNREHDADEMDLCGMLNIKKAPRTGYISLKKASRHGIRVDIGPDNSPRPSTL